MQGFMLCFFFIPVRTLYSRKYLAHSLTQCDPGSIEEWFEIFSVSLIWMLCTRGHYLIINMKNLPQQISSCKNIEKYRLDNSKDIQSSMRGEKVLHNGIQCQMQYVVMCWGPDIKKSYMFGVEPNSQAGGLRVWTAGHPHMFKTFIVQKWPYKSEI